ncbi:MAG TPA: ABC transporter permease [Flavobacteriales bacterium]|nr:ABC transporter permease [Flavobacteriales bacterium]HIA11781.1 ABC transporter permease [Flavobacteriales bacterium]
MILKISWRNVWRNKLRSGVVMTSIALGIWAGLAVMGLSVGLNDQRIDSSIKNTLSHIQIHHPEFLSDNNVAFYIENSKDISEFIAQSNTVAGFTNRMKINGMVASSAGGYGVNISGIQPESEKTVTELYTKIIDGKYFQDIKRNPVVISQRLAKKLKVKIRSKIVLTFQNDNGDIVAGAFRIAGIYKTVSSRYDDVNVFVDIEDVQKLLGGLGKIHEIAILLTNMDAVNPFKEELRGNYPDLTIRSWDEISPELGYANELMGTAILIFIGIIMLALAFGIINTMLMAVLERKRELGMLMSVGMNRLKVFTMIVVETIFLALMGGPLGLAFGYFTIQYFGTNGIDLSIVGEGMESFGVGMIVYTSMEAAKYAEVGIMVIITAILSSIYPAYKALKLNPAEAVRAI